RIVEDVGSERRMRVGGTIVLEVDAGGIGAGREAEWDVVGSCVLGVTLQSLFYRNIIGSVAVP
ncbi:hypothetical protein Tco_1512783, partial [Tanacetum coccineum]